MSGGGVEERLPSRGQSQGRVQFLYDFGELRLWQKRVDNLVEGEDVEDGSPGYTQMLLSAVVGEGQGSSQQQEKPHWMTVDSIVLSSSP